MPYVVKAGRPTPLSLNEQSRIRKAAWDANKNWWGAALFLFVIAIPSIMILPGVICIVASAVVFVITLTKVEANYAAALSAAEQSSRNGADSHARWQTELASKHLRSMSAERTELDSQLKIAVAAIGKARAELTQRIYTLFWENLERAAAALVDADSSGRMLLNYFGEYKKALDSEQHTFPSLPTPVTEIPNQSKIERELKELIRTGLRNEKCATVWESWRARHDDARIDRYVAQL